ncbi:MAG: hypothetical protein SGILL_009949, partial [Bacillariaceae sp.]
EAVDAMIQAGMASTPTEAIIIAKRLQKELRLFSHVAGHHLFKDDYLFYRVSEIYGMPNATQFEPEELLEKAQQFRQLADIKNRKYRFKKYKNCFVASEIIDSIVYTGLAGSRQEAVQLGRALQQHLDWFRHVTDDHHFKDDHLFYRFNVTADMLSSVASTSSISHYSNYQLPKSISPSPSTTSSMTSTWSTSSGGASTSPSAKLQQQTKAVMLRKINENLKAANYTPSVVGNLENVMGELQDKVSTIYTGHHNVIESDGDHCASSQSRESPPPLPTQPRQSDIVFRPPPLARGSINVKFEEEKSVYDEFTILEETVGDESLYIEETIVEEPIKEGAYSYDDYGFGGSDEISAITQVTL